MAIHSRPQLTRATTQRAGYQAYLNSEHWTNLRNWLHLRCRGRCEACDHDASVWPIDGHHLLYRTPLESGVLSDLMALCRRCHDIVHDLNIPVLFSDGTPVDVRRSRTIAEIRRYLPDLYPLTPVKKWPKAIVAPGQTPPVHRIPLPASHPVRVVTLGRRWRRHHSPKKRR